MRDTNVYYYWFSDQPGAFYTERKPTSPSMPPSASAPKNYATVEMQPGGPVLTWKAVGTLAGTVETFTRANGNSENEMKGSSNQYGALTARKM